MKQKRFYQEPSLYIIFGIMALTVISYQCATHPTAEELTAPEIHHFIAPPLTAKDTFKAEFGDHSGIYDGDTWTDMYITIKTFDGENHPPEILWDGIFLGEDKLYVVTDIRLKGIDTPEKRPARAGRTPESIAREKAAAEAAKDAVEALLEKHEWDFVITEPERGKYAGRTVANILVGTERISIADFLIEKGLGYRYDGGKKKAFDTWYQSPD